MEKTQRIPQIYGYLVCLVAVITFLISIAQLVNSVIDLTDPIHAGWSAPGSPSLASYENYKMDILKSTDKADNAATAAYVPDEATLKAMYRAAHDDKILLESHRAYRNIFLNGLLVAVCVLLFTIHWRWMKKLDKQAA